MELTPQQRHWRRYFDDFGFLWLPGFFAAEIGWISQEFERLLQEQGSKHDGTKRTGCHSPLESSERLGTLLTDSRLVGVLNAVLGEDYEYLGSAGELYTGDGMWHPDGVFKDFRRAKFAMYLDPLTPQTGALRVVPGSHLQGWEGNLDPRALWGISNCEVPCASFDNKPGDAIIFNLHTLHNSLGGGYRRRMLNAVFKSKVVPGLAPRPA